MTDLTPEQKIDEILKYAVDHAYEVMDSKSFEDPFARAKQQLLALKSKWEAEARIDELRKTDSEDSIYIFVNEDDYMFKDERITQLESELNQLTNGDK